MLILAYWCHNVWTGVGNRRPGPLFVLHHQDFSAHRMLRWFWMFAPWIMSIETDLVPGHHSASTNHLLPKTEETEVTVSIVELQTSLDASFSLFFHLQGHCFYLNPGRIQKMRVRLRLQLTNNQWHDPRPCQSKTCIHNLCTIKYWRPFLLLLTLYVLTM